MSPATMKILLLAVALVIWSLFGKRILAFLLTRSVARGVLRGIGQDAVNQQPDWITLTRVAVPQWRNAAAVEEFTRPLLAGGFSDVGVFTVDKMPGVKVAILVKPEDHVNAYVYEHPKAATWIELVTRYWNGSSHTLTTLPATGIERPEWVRTIRCAKGPAMDLVRRLIQERKPGELITITPDNAVRDFQENYAKYMLWMKNRKITAEEVAQVVRKWADGRSVQAAATK